MSQPAASGVAEQQSFRPHTGKRTQCKHRTSFQLHTEEEELVEALRRPLHRASPPIATPRCKLAAAWILVTELVCAATAFAL